MTRQQFTEAHQRINEISAFGSVSRIRTFASVSDREYAKARVRERRAQAMFDDGYDTWEEARGER